MKPDCRAQCYLSTRIWLCQRDRFQRNALVAARAVVGFGVYQPTGHISFDIITKVMDGSLTIVDGDMEWRDGDVERVGGGSATGISPLADFLS